MESVLVLDSEKQWITAEKKRVSVRKYADGVTDEQLRKLEKLAAQLSGDRNVRILISTHADSLFKGMLAGKFENISVAAAFVAKEITPIEEVGYRGEAFVLGCTSLGLGTCWTAATFSKKEAERIFILMPGEKLFIVTPIGNVVNGEMPDNPMRDRKSLEKLTGLKEKDIENLKQWQKEGLLSAQSAPSAMNMQPLSYIVADNYIEIQPSGVAFLPRALDMGIAMLHLELGITNAGESGEWQKSGKGYKFIVK